jgi:hypothetical protein
MNYILSLAVFGALAVAGYFVVRKMLKKAATVAPVIAPVLSDTAASAPVMTSVAQAGTTAS